MGGRRTDKGRTENRLIGNSKFTNVFPFQSRSLFTDAVFPHRSISINQLFRRGFEEISARVHRYKPTHTVHPPSRACGRNRAKVYYTGERYVYTKRLLLPLHSDRHSFARTKMIRRQKLFYTFANQRQVSQRPFERIQPSCEGIETLHWNNEGAPINAYVNRPFISRPFSSTFERSLKFVEANSRRCASIDCGRSSNI